MSVLGEHQWQELLNIKLNQWRAAPMGLSEVVAKFCRMEGAATEDTLSAQMLQHHRILPEGLHIAEPQELIKTRSKGRRQQHTQELIQVLLYHAARLEHIASVKASI